MNHRFFHGYLFPYHLHLPSECPNTAKNSSQARYSVVLPCCQGRGRAANSQHSALGAVRDQRVKDYDSRSLSLHATVMFVGGSAE